MGMDVIWLWKDSATSASIWRKHETEQKEDAGVLRGAATFGLSDVYGMSYRGETGLFCVKERFAYGI